MADVDTAKALAEGYTQEEIDAENEKRRRAPPPEPAPAAPAKPSFGETFSTNVANTLALPGEWRKGAQRSVAATGRGVRQLAASVAPGLVDPEAARLAEVAATKEDLEHPPSTASNFGKTVADVAPWMAAGAYAVPALAYRGASMLPQAIQYAKMIPKWASYLGGGAAGGAAQELVEPETGEYKLGKKAGYGAGFGALTSPLGKIGAFLASPFTRASAGPAAKESARILNDAGLPHQLPTTQVGGDTSITSMSNTLEKIPFLGDVLKRKREENAAWLTKRATEGTGKGVPHLTQAAQEEMFNRLNAEGNAFRTSKKIDMTSVASEASTAQKAVEEYAATTAQEAKKKYLEAAAETLKAMPGNNAAAQRAMIGYPVPHYPGIATERTANEVMNLRNAASELAFKETDTTLKLGFQRYKNELENKLRREFGTDRFNTWLKQWGEMEDVTRAAGGKSGEYLKQGHLTPERLAMNLDDSFRPGSEMDKLVAAARRNMPTPPPGDPRAIATSLMLGGGSIVGGGGLGQLAGGNPTIGAAIPATLGMSLMAGLSRKAMTPAQKAMVRRMVMAGLISEDPL